MYIYTIHTWYGTVGYSMYLVPSSDPDYTTWYQEVCYPVAASGLMGARTTGLAGLASRPIQHALQHSLADVACMHPRMVGSRALRPAQHPPGMSTWGG